MQIDDPRSRIAVARRMLYRAGCDTGIAQHVSERAADWGSVWVSALDHGDRTNAGSVARFDFEKSLIEAREEVTDPPLEYAPDYIEIYQARRDVGAVVHTHSFWAMVLCAVGEPIGMFNSTASLLAGDQVVWQDDLFESARGRAYGRCP